MHQSKLFEGLETDDLKRLVHDELHIDEFKSKMGNDEDIVVISFKIKGREPAYDLVNFLEKGYEWVIDSDVSSGEMDDGDYVVFVECDREPSVATNIIEMMKDIMNLTGQELSDWRVKFKSSSMEHELSVESIKQHLPLTPEDYKSRFGKKSAELDEMRAAAGVPITTKAPKNEYTQSLRSLAGIL
jgi:hypothetical protein